MAQQIKITQTSNADMNIGVPKNMTAVEWLSIELQKVMGTDVFYYSIKEQVEKAKQMEKEQIVKAYKFGLEDEFVIGSEKYYNQTYNV